MPVGCDVARSEGLLVLCCLFSSSSRAYFPRYSALFDWGYARMISSSRERLGRPSTWSSPSREERECSEILDHHHFAAAVRGTLTSTNGSWFQPILREETQDECLHPNTLRPPPISRQLPCAG